MTYYALFLAFPFQTQIHGGDEDRYAVDRRTSGSQGSNFESFDADKKGSERDIIETFSAVEHGQDDNMSQAIHRSVNIV